MRVRSARFDTAIASSHDLAVRVDVLFNRRVIIGGEGNPGLSVRDDANSEITFDRTAAVMARLLLSAAEPTRLPTATDGGPLSPFGYELQPWRGISYTDGTSEVLPQGVFPIQDSQFDGLTLEGDLNALDRSQLVTDAVFEEDYQVAAGLNTATVIRAIVEAGVPGLEFAFQTTPFTTPFVVFSAGDDRWEACRALAKSIGCEVYFDGYGRCVLRDEPGANADPALHITDGEGGNLVAVTLKLDRAPAFNRVIVTGENSNLAQVYRGVATDDDPASPTFYDGPFGRKTMFYPTPLITSDAQGAVVAAAVLTANSGVAQSVTVSAVPNPALEPGDIARITDASLDVDDLYIIDGYTMGLTAESVMGTVV